MISKLRQSLLWILLVVFSFFLYWSCRQAPFIWDDQFLVVKNPLIRSPILIGEIFRHFLGDDPPSNFYRPVQTLTYLLDYWRGGLDFSIFHDGSTLVHGLNGILISVFVAGLLRKEGVNSEKTVVIAATLVACLWLAHPIHSATVAYIAGRADSLALLFLLAGWCLWAQFLKSTHRHRWIFPILIFGCGFLAICSKEAALIGVGVFLVWNCFSNNLPNRKNKILLTASCLALMGIYLSLRLTIGYGEASQATGPLGNRALLVLRALGDYLRLIFYPSNLRMERQIIMVPNLFRDPATFDPLYAYLAIFGALFVGLLIISAFWKGSFRRIRQLGVLWFVASILPVSNIFALNATVAEHWLYLPSVGFFLIIIGWTLETPPRIQQILAVIAVGAIIGLSVRTKIRALDWTSPTVFFESTIRDGGDTARIRVNLANEYLLSGRLKKGEELLRSTLALSPGYAQARHGLVVNLNVQGRREEARALFANDDNPFGNSFRGQLYTAQRHTRNGEIVQASAILKTLRETNPDSWLLTKEIGSLFDKMEQPDQKVRLYKNFVENHWWHAESHLELARLYELAQMPREASEIYYEAARLDIRNPTVRARAEALQDFK